MTDPLARPLRLPCGAVLPNRLCKAAMTEGVADPLLRATPRHETLYRTWSEGGAGLLLTGNVQVDRADLERPGNVSVDVSEPRTVSPEARERLRAWARAGTVAGNHLWMQISQAGWQSPRYVTKRPRAPSDVQLDLLGNYAKPVPLAETEILDLIHRFAQAAVIARETGFTGVQIHGAHGYLLSSFLSPVTNRRTDAWGGSLENRARMLLEVVRAVRKAVGRDFPVALKLNSDDFRKGGFTNAECLEVVRWLNDESLDLLELSGGTYEQPRLIGAEGRTDSAVAVRPSTRAREAYFLEYAEVVRKIARMPLMVTGGFRTRAGMEAALDGDCDVVGLGRPLCWQPDFPRRLLAHEADAVERIEDRLNIRARGWLSPTSPIVPIRMLNIFGAQSWYYCQVFRLADGKPAELDRGVLSTLGEYLADEHATARRMHRAYGD
ncbi:MAG: NADH:flavin oxidoreductase/NADH oxidase family protein [Gammaproteobacteria bacterium]|nr:NADH:flavin oxidoreductase/NADH oxidase family protein [Gammaproteobacteria bacterium]